MNLVFYYAYIIKKPCSHLWYLWNVVFQYQIFLWIKWSLLIISEWQWSKRGSEYILILSYLFYYQFIFFLDNIVYFFTEIIFHFSHTKSKKNSHHTDLLKVDPFTVPVFFKGCVFITFSFANIRFLIWCYTENSENIQFCVNVLITTRTYCLD